MFGGEHLRDTIFCVAVGTIGTPAIWLFRGGQLGQALYFGIPAGFFCGLLGAAGLWARNRQR
jgi:hypothetical protein